MLAEVDYDKVKIHTFFISRAGIGKLYLSRTKQSIVSKFLSF